MAEVGKEPITRKPLKLVGISDEPVGKRKPLKLVGVGQVEVETEVAPGPEPPAYPVTVTEPSGAISREAPREKVIVGGTEFDLPVGTEIKPQTTYDIQASAKKLFKESSPVPAIREAKVQREAPVELKEQNKDFFTRLTPNVVRGNEQMLLEYFQTLPEEAKQKFMSKEIMNQEESLEFYRQAVQPIIKGIEGNFAIYSQAKIPQFVEQTAKMFQSISTLQENINADRQRLEQLQNTPNSEREMQAVNIRLQNNQLQAVALRDQLKEQATPEMMKLADQYTSDLDKLAKISRDEQLIELTSPEVAKKKLEVQQAAVNRLMGTPVDDWLKKSYNSIIKAAGDLASGIPRAAGTLSEGYTLSDQVADSISELFAPKVTTTETTVAGKRVSGIPQFYDHQTNTINWSSIMDEAMNQSGSFLVLAGTGGLGRAAGISDFGSIVAPGYLLALEGAKQEGQQRYPDDPVKAMLYTQFSAGISGLTEKLMPDVDILSGKMRQEISDAFVKNYLVKGPKAAAAIALKDLTGKMSMENLEELADVWKTVVLDAVASVDDPRIKAKIPTLNEQLSIIASTSLLTGLGGAGGAMANTQKLQDMALYNAATNYGETVKILSRLGEEGVNPKKIQAIRDKVDAVKQNLRELPQDGSLSIPKQIEIAKRLDEIQGLQKRISSGVSPIIADIAATQIKQAQKEIQNIIEDPAFDENYAKEVNKEAGTLQQQQLEPITPQEDAQTIRSDEGQVQEAGTLGQSSQTESGEDLQRDTQEEPGDQIEQIAIQPREKLMSAGKEEFIGSLTDGSIEETVQQGSLTVFDVMQKVEEFKLPMPKFIEQMESEPISEEIGHRTEEQDQQLGQWINNAKERSGIGTLNLVDGGGNVIERAQTTAEEAIIPEQLPAAPLPEPVSSQEGGEETFVKAEPQAETITETVKPKKDGTKTVSRQVKSDKTSRKKPTKAEVEKVKRISQRGKTPKHERKIKHPDFIRALQLEVTQPYDQVMKYFINGGKIKAKVIQQILGSKKKNVNKEVIARVGILNKDSGAESVDELAHHLWQAQPNEGQFESTDFRDAVQDVVKDFTTASDMVTDMLKRYEQERADETAYYDERLAEEDQTIQDEIAEIAGAWWDELSDEEKARYSESPPAEEEADQIALEVEDQKERVPQQERAPTTETESAVTREDIEPAVTLVNNALKSAGITAEIIDSPEEYENRVKELGGQPSEGSQGIFLSESGKILLNPSRMQQGWEQVTVWHEGTHPVINIIRNTDPKKFQQLVLGMLNAADKNPDVKEAVDFIPEGASLEARQDEQLVEVIARIADGAIDLGALPKSFKQDLIDFVNKIARALGMSGDLIKSPNDEVFRKTAYQIAQALRSGEDITTIVGKKNVKETEFTVAQESKGDRKRREKSLLNRAYVANPAIQEAIASFGLDYDVENQDTAYEQAREFIDEVGFHNALAAARNKQLTGSQYVFVMANLIDMASKDPAATVPAYMRNIMLNELDMVVRQFGQAISGLKKVYEVSDFAYAIDRLKDSLKEVSPKSENGTPVPDPKVMKQLEQLAKTIAEQDKKIAQLEEELSRQRAQETVDTISETEMPEDDEVEKAHKSKRPTIDEDDKIHIPQKILYDLVKGGITEANALADAVKEMLQQDYPERTFSTRQVRDAISKYGERKHPPQDEILQKISELKRDSQLLSGNEDALAGKLPEKSGYQRPKPTDLQRRLTRAIKDLIRQFPETQEDINKKWATANDRIKTTLENRKHDLQRQIKEGKREKRATTPIELTEENKALKAEVAQLEEALDALDPKTISHEDRVKAAIRILERQIEQVQSQIDTRELAAKAKQKVEDPRIDVLRQRLAQARDILNKMRQEAGIVEQERIDAYKKLVAKQIKKLQEQQKQLRKGTFVKKERPSRKLDAELKKLLVERDYERRKVNILLEKEKRKQRTFLQKAGGFALDVGNIPRSIIASTDLSMLLRQGVMLGLRNPTIAARALSQALSRRMLGNKKNYEMWYLDLMRDPDYLDMKKAGLYIGIPSSHLAAREEEFMSTIASRLPHVRWSERAYNMYLNKLRVDTFKQFKTAIDSDKQLTDEQREEEMKNYANFINMTTGRGKLGILTGAAPILNAVLFSPRFVASRFGVIHDTLRAINPKSKYSKHARQEALKTMALYGGVAAAILMLASLAGADVDDDPLSSDYGKIKIGDTRFDIFAGLQQAVVFLNRLTAGIIDTIGNFFEFGRFNAYTDSETGESMPLNMGGMNERTVFSIAENFFSSKSSPNFTAAREIFGGLENEHDKYFFGTKIASRGDKATPASVFGPMLAPISLNDLLEMYSKGDEAMAAAVGASSFFGLGTSDYPPNATKAMQKLATDILNTAPDDPAYHRFIDSDLSKLSGYKKARSTSPVVRELYDKHRDRIQQYANEDERFLSNMRGAINYAITTSILKDKPQWMTHVLQADDTETKLEIFNMATEGMDAQEKRKQRLFLTSVRAMPPPDGWSRDQIIDEYLKLESQ